MADDFGDFGDFGGENQEPAQAFPTNQGYVPAMAAPLQANDDDYTEEE